MASGAGVIAQGTDHGANREQLYFVSYPKGEVSRITNDANSYTSFSAMANGKNLCVTQRESNFQLYMIRPDGEISKRISDQRDDGIGGLAFGSNNDIYYISSQSGSIYLWAVNADGSGRRQVTSDSARDQSPSVTPDGRSILFTSWTSSETPSIWRINIDGSGRQRLTSGSEEYDPAMEPGGKWIVISSWFTGPLTIMKIPAAGGERAPLSMIAGVSPVISPDGKLVYFVHTDNLSPIASVYSIPIEGGPSTKIFDLPGQADPYIRCRRGHSELSYVVSVAGVSNVWTSALDGSGAKPFTHFHEDNLADFQWSPDGNSLVVSRGKLTTDVILITEEN